MKTFNWVVLILFMGISLFAPLGGETSYFYPAVEVTSIQETERDKVEYLSEEVNCPPIPKPITL